MFTPLILRLCIFRNDKKLGTDLTGVKDGCAYCEEPKDTWSAIDTISNGFKLTRTLAGLEDLWESLDKNKDGELIRRTGDYEVRKGLCHKPVTIRPLWHFTVCHKVQNICCSLNFYLIILQWSHFLDHKIKILIHLMVGHFDWNQYKWVLAEVKKAKMVVQQTLKPGGGGPESSNIGSVHLTQE